MAGFSSFSQRWRLRAEIAKDQITSLYAGTNHDSRYEVVSCHVDCQSRPISNLYFHRFLRQSRPHSLHRRVALRSTSPPPQPHGGARRTPLALSRVRPPFDGDSDGSSTKLGNSKRTSPRNSHRCCRHGDDALRCQQRRPSNLGA